MDEFDIYIRSFRAGGPERPELALRRVFGLDEEQAREFVASLPRVVKRRVPDRERGRYAKVLGEMGAELEFRRSPIQPIQTVAVKGVGPGEAGAPPPRQPGHILTLGDLLADPGSVPTPARPAPVWPAPVAPTARIDAEAVASLAPAAAPFELGMAHTQRVEASASPRPSGGAPPGQPTPATAVQPPQPRAWTVANTPAVGASTGEAFAANPVKGPANATLRQQPAFGEGAVPAAVPAAVVPEAAPAAAAQADRLGTHREVVEVRHASSAIASAEAASLAAGWQDPVLSAAAARPARPLASTAPQVDAAHAYSQASTSDSMKLDPLEAPRQPSWLVQESKLRQQVVSATPEMPALDSLELGEQPVYGRGLDLRTAESRDLPEDGMAGEAYDGDPAGAWLLSLGREGGARGGPRPTTSMRAAPQPVASQRPGPAGAGPFPIANLPSGAPGPRIESRFAVRSAGIPERPQRRTLSRALGLEGRSLPFGVRLLLRVGLGVSAFLLLLMLRSCPLLTTDLQRELAQFDRGEAVGVGEGEPGAATELSLVQGEKAHEWIEAGDHQFRDPSTGELLVDKDPIRGLVSRLHRIGAREVYVYGVQRVDLIVYAEGIDVVLPDDASQRGAIFLEEARFHRLDAPSVPDTGQARLRIRVP